MCTYIAKFASPSKASVQASGTFEFESSARIGSRKNMHDARMRMLELYGKDACPWIIGKIERAKPGRNHSRKTALTG